MKNKNKFKPLEAPRYTCSFPLQPVFMKNVDNTGDQIFTQVRREGNLAIYRRNRCCDGSLFGFEVITIRLIPEGTSLPGGAKVESDYESYAGSSAFGKIAWFFPTEDLADDKLKKVFKEQKASGPTVMAFVHTPAEVIADESHDIPTGEFTQKTFALHNCMPERGVVYSVLQALINKGVVKVSRRLQMGVGRATVLYSAAA